MDAYLDIKNLTKYYSNNESAALKDFNLKINKESILGVVGESGCGKTTLARLITGLERPQSGTILMNDNVLTSKATFIAPEKRNIGMLFQDFALFPHLNVFKNIAYGLSSSSQHRSQVEELLKLVGLTDLEKRYPHQLSGGQQQRVALARALAADPDILILDEPFSNLDTNLRIKLRDEIVTILKKSAMTSIFITHNASDALAIADMILVLKNGKRLCYEKKSHFSKKLDDDYIKSLLVV